VSRVFWDTNLFLYLLEGSGPAAERTVALRERMLERGDLLFTSALTLGEILVKPVAAGEVDLAREIRAAITSSASIVALDVEAAEHYADIRVDRAVRAPDAIQLACAARAGIDLFVTNDERLSRRVVRGIEFITSLERAFL
jgi:predicted nucleic acid-binding protein